MKWRFLISHTGNAYYNMALDKALFLSYPYVKQPTLRIYSWRQPSISIGVNQKLEDAVCVEYCRQKGVPVVRRLTGGSAIYHDQELTYSLVCMSRDLSLPNNVKESYKVLCSFLIKAYKVLGLRAGFSLDNPLFGSYKRRTEFCFSSWEDYDIVINNKKIGGNAQKRRKDLIFQHGSIPFNLDYKEIRSSVRLSDDSWEFRTGFLDSLLKKKLVFKEFADILRRSFEESFCVKLEYGWLTEYEESVLSGLLEPQLNICRESPGPVSDDINA